MSQADWSERDDRDRARSVWKEVGIGIGIVMLEHLVFGGLFGGGGYLIDQINGGYGEALIVFWFWLFGIGLTQLGYILPTFVVCFLARRNIAAGVALGALATFLLNGACFGVLCGAVGANF